MADVKIFMEFSSVFVTQASLWMSLEGIVRISMSARIRSPACMGSVSMRMEDTSATVRKDLILFQEVTGVLTAEKELAIWTSGRHYQDTMCVAPGWAKRLAGLLVAVVLARRGVPTVRSVRSQAQRNIN
jgi:hypothetical protein